MLEREPFEPFRICLSSGESYRVLNPHTVALLKNRLFAALTDSDRSTFVSYMHIAALETLGTVTRDGVVGRGADGIPSVRHPGHAQINLGTPGAAPFSC